jgi:metallo-beta-lactamase family protein
LSGHADYLNLTDWLQSSNLAPNTNILLVHGEPEASEHMRDHLMQHTKFNVDIASYRKIFRL